MGLFVNVSRFKHVVSDQQLGQGQGIALERFASGADELCRYRYCLQGCRTYPGRGFRRIGCVLAPALAFRWRGHRLPAHQRACSCHGRAPDE